MPLKVWPNTALGCNHQPMCMPQLQPLTSKLQFSLISIKKRASMFDRFNFFWEEVNLMFLKQSYSYIFSQEFEQMCHNFRSVLEGKKPRPICIFENLADFKQHVMPSKQLRWVELKYLTETMFRGEYQVSEGGWGQRRHADCASFFVRKKHPTSFWLDN